MKLVLLLIISYKCTVNGLQLVEGFRYRLQGLALGERLRSNLREKLSLVAVTSRLLVELEMENPPLHSTHYTQRRSSGPSQGTLEKISAFGFAVTTLTTLPGFQITFAQDTTGECGHLLQKSKMSSWITLKLLYVLTTTTKETFFRTLLSNNSGGSVLVLAHRGIQAESLGVKKLAPMKEQAWVKFVKVSVGRLPKDDSYSEKMRSHIYWSEA
ncbi:hypothetical protein BT69DRAFT_1306589 [Atractiella rhizophila]|nr:hypothetical protein BT69DRAFT_1306589 [Atractiella rhizophila]